MARPAFLFCDTDAVIQFLLAGEVRPFRLLRSKYSIQPIVVPEVEIELQSHKRLGKRIASELKKALANDLLRMLDKSVLESYYGGQSAGSMAATAAMAQISKRGRDYEKHVDFGEAYTHAAALEVNVPAMSHDLDALDTLISAGFPVPATVLRAFDLITLCNQVNEMSERDCDGFRGFLVGESEHVPKCFRNKSFGGGLKDFYPRIRDSSYPPIGGTGGPTFPFSTMILL